MFFSRAGLIAAITHVIADCKKNRHKNIPCQFYPLNSQSQTSLMLHFLLIHFNRFLKLRSVEGTEQI